MANKKNSSRVERVYSDNSVKEIDKSTNVDDSFFAANETEKNRDASESYSAFSSSNNNSVIIENDTTKKQKIKKVHRRIRSAKYARGTFLKKVKTLAILIFLGVFTGSGLGVWYYNTLLRSTVDYDNLNPEDYEADYGELFSETLGISTPNDTQWVANAQSQEKTPASFTAIQNFELAHWNAMHASSFTVFGHGGVNTLGVTQGIYSGRRYDGNAYCFESISTGMVSAIGLDYMKKGSNIVYNYEGSNPQKDDSATWKQTGSMTLEEYTDAIGNPPSVVQPYIISEKTVDSASEVEYNEENETYTFTLELNKVFSVLRYAKQMKKTGGLGSYPEFEYVTQVVTIDKDWNLVSIDIKEQYSAVAFGMKVGCSGTLFNEFTFNGEVALPVSA